MGLEGDESEFKYESSPTPDLWVAWGKSLALPDPHFLHLNMNAQCEAWEAVSVRPWAQFSSTLLFYI